MEGSSVLIEIVSSISKIFFSDLKEGKYYLYNFECIYFSGMILGQLIRNDEINRDFNLVENILKKLESTFETLLQLRKNPEMTIFVWENSEWVQVKYDKMLSHATKMVNLVSGQIMGHDRRRQFR